MDSNRKNQKIDFTEFETFITKKALNANYQIAIRKISGELYIGYEIEEK